MNTKNKLKSIGISLIFLGLIFSFVGPIIFLTPNQTGMTASEQLDHQIKDERKMLPIMGLTGMFLGAGIALLITGYRIKEKEIHNEGASFRDVLSNEEK